MIGNWWRGRGHDTNDVWCVYWVGHCRGPIARCPKCVKTGGYYALRKTQIAAEAALAEVGALAQEPMGGYRFMQDYWRQMALIRKVTGTETASDKHNRAQPNPTATQEATP